MVFQKRHLNKIESSGDSIMRGMTCLVTGATSGIGEHTAYGLARLGATVLMVARNAERGAAVAADIRIAAPQGKVELFHGRHRRERRRLPRNPRRANIFRRNRRRLADGSSATWSPAA